MDWSVIFEYVGKAATATAAVAGAYWAFLRWQRHDELFPRVEFEVSANFLGVQGDHVVTELVAVLENKGQVPLKIHDFTFKLLGLSGTDMVVKGGPDIRRQLLFPAVLDQGDFVPRTWEYSFVYPGVRTEYSFVTALPREITFVRMQADFAYLDRENASHHAAKVLAVEVPGSPPRAGTVEVARVDER